MNRENVISCLENIEATAARVNESMTDAQLAEVLQEIENSLSEAMESAASAEKKLLNN